MKNGFQRILCTAAIAAGVLTAVFAFFARNSLCLTLAITFGTTFYHFALRLLVGWLGRIFFPKGGENASWFREKPWEPGLYRFLRVRRWKNKMPTFDPDSFDLKKHTLGEIVRTTCIAEITHEIIMPLSFLPLLAIPRYGAAPVFAVTSALAAAFDGVFVIMQRCNRPRLIRLQKKEEMRP